MVLLIAVIQDTVDLHVQGIVLRDGWVAFSYSRPIVAVQNVLVLESLPPGLFLAVTVTVIESDHIVRGGEPYCAGWRTLTPYKGNDRMT